MPTTGLCRVSGPVPARRSCRWKLPSHEPAAGGGTEKSVPVHAGQVALGQPGTRVERTASLSGRRKATGVAVRACNRARPGGRQSGQELERTSTQRHNPVADARAFRPCTQPSAACVSPTEQSCFPGTTSRLAPVSGAAAMLVQVSPSTFRQGQDSPTCMTGAAPVAPVNNRPPTRRPACVPSVSPHDRMPVDRPQSPVRTCRRPCNERPTDVR